MSRHLGLSTASHGVHEGHPLYFCSFSDICSQGLSCRFLSFAVLMLHMMYTNSTACRGADLWKGQFVMDVGICTERGRAVGRLHDSEDWHDGFRKSLLSDATRSYASCESLFGQMMHFECCTLEYFVFVEGQVPWEGLASKFLCPQRLPSLWTLNACPHKSQGVSMRWGEDLCNVHFFAISLIHTVGY